MAVMFVEQVRETRTWRRLSPHLRWLAAGETPKVDDMPPLEVKRLTLTEQFDEAWQIVLAKYGPHHVDRTHSFVTYHDNGYRPGCVVGQVLVQMGVPIDYLMAHTSVQNVVRTHFGDGAESDRIVHGLARAIEANDSFASWGACHAAYRRYSR